MSKFKRSYYQVSQPIGGDLFLCSCFQSQSHILLTKQCYVLFNGDEDALDKLERNHSSVFKRLQQGGFLIRYDIDELSQQKQAMWNALEDDRIYHVIVNPTLDCNLNCWYCYENKISKSAMSEDVVAGICRHISKYYEFRPFQELKLSFFGGEPFMKPFVIKQLVDFGLEFCKSMNLKLILDFTTNGTLISQSILNSIKMCECIFQITIDGNQKQHNRIKYSKSKRLDAFSTTISNIYRIQQTIKNSFVFVRINFDKDTLLDFDSILREIDGLDRNRTCVILKKVWQVDSDDISKPEIMAVVERLLQSDFVVDYYNQGGICFADRLNQVTFNYDGNVFKCTTISSFDEENSLGVLDCLSGNIKWDDEKTRYLSQRKIQSRCEKCRMFPKCGGLCRKKMSLLTEETCFLDSLKLTIEEYALIQFKVELTKYKKYDTKQMH